MPKRSFRAAMNKSKINNYSSSNNDSNNNSNIGNNCDKRDDSNTLASNLVSEGMPAEHCDPAEALETYYAPKELKRQIAEALRETSMKKNNRPGKDADRTVKQSASVCGDKKYSKIVFNCYENNSERVGKKMVYADVVRSSPKVEKKDFCKSSQEVDSMNSDNNMVTDSKKLFCEKQDVLKPLANPSGTNNNKSEVTSNKSGEASDKSEVASECSLRGCDTRNVSCSVSESETCKESLSNLLANLDPEILQELEMDEAAWEVVSIGEWSHCGSDTDEQFLLINGDAGVDTGDGNSVSDGGCGTAGAESNGTTASETCSGKSDREVLQSTSNDAKEKKKYISPADQVSKVVPTGSSAVANANIDVTSTTNKTDSSRAAINSYKSGAAGTASAPTAAPAPIKKKKVLVTRKYIGGPDLMQRLKRLGLHRVGAETEDTMQWTGVYKTGQLIVEARRRCSLLVVSVKAECESLLLGLTCLQGLMEDTGLLSYARLNLPALLQPPK